MVGHDTGNVAADDVRTTVAMCDGGRHYDDAVAIPPVTMPPGGRGIDVPGASAVDPYIGRYGPKGIGGGEMVTPQGGSSLGVPGPPARWRVPLGRHGSS